MLHVKREFNSTFSHTVLYGFYTHIWSGHFRFNVSPRDIPHPDANWDRFAKYVATLSERYVCIVNGTGTIRSTNHRIFLIMHRFLSAWIDLCVPGDQYGMCISS